MKFLAIAVIVIIAGLGIWRFTANRVDMTKPEAVAAAFVQHLKANRVDKAGNYWVPTEADAWRTSATSRLETMQSGTFTRFMEDLPVPDATYTSTRKPKAPQTEQTLSSGNVNLDMRQIDGKWYVCKGPI
jgi:hypothetical protein